MRIPVPKWLARVVNDLAIEKIRDYQFELANELAKERREASRWRERALLCEDKGPTCGEVDAVFQENIRLKAEVTVLTERLNGGK